ncbi:MAG: hypothetical protein EPN25_00285 [Nitrospirae bacterium]|nr:MAG: hypothetical protein EPN25_00285 [Nitrospirota bacterium]
MRKRVCLVILVIGSLFLSAAAGWASEPVKHKSQGCVINGKVYTIYDPSTVYRLQLPKSFNVKPYEGKKVQLEGMLSPSDRFEPNGKTLKVLGPCDKAAINLIRKTEVK